MVLAATAVGTAGIVVFAVLPVLVGLISDRFGLSDAQAGNTASAYFLVYALIALSAPLWIRRANWRILAAAGCLTMIAGLCWLSAASGFQAVISAMLLTGAGASVLLPISLTLVADMVHVDRAYGITVSAEQLIPALLIFALSAGLFGGYDLQNALWACIVLTIICIMASYALPSRGRPRQEAQRDQPKRYLAYLSLVALGISFAGFASLWAFAERLAVNGGLAQAFSARWIAVGLVMTAVGPLVAAVVETRFGRVLPIALGTVLCVASLVGLTGTTTEAGYATVLVLFPLSYYFVLSYVLSIIADADRGGSASSLMSFALACGALAGPSIFGVLKGNAALISVSVLVTAGAALAGYVQTRIAPQAS